MTPIWYLSQCFNTEFYTGIRDGMFLFLIIPSVAYGTSVHVDVDVIYLDIHIIYSSIGILYVFILYYLYTDNLKMSSTISHGNVTHIGEYILIHL